METSRTTQKPFLKWAGSKTRLVGPLKKLFPPGNHRYVEPFVGSGAAFLNTNYPRSILCDSNPDLISLYRTLQQEGSKFIEVCRGLFIPENNTPARFYQLRSEFNKSKQGERRAGLFLYLNRHCYNGLCRFNSAGEFNTPFGRYERPYFPEKEMVVFAERLQSAELKCQDFKTTFAEVQPGDVVYCDPPYVPLSRTANFTSYATGGFSHADQEKLAELSARMAGQGATVVVSNHDTSGTRLLYREAAHLEAILVQRMISCNGDDRKKTKELIAVFRRDWPLKTGGSKTEMPKRGRNTPATPASAG